MITTDNRTEYLIGKYNNEIIEICESYNKIIHPFVAQLEIIDGEFPVEILNEIRAIFQHLIRCYALNKEDAIKKNIDKARSHLKRAILDCFKYLCVSFDEEYKKFLHTFRHVDLREINQGAFLIDITRTYQEAKDLLIDAKEAEALSEDVQNCFSSYESAYNKYCALHKLITSNQAYATTARRKQFVKHLFAALGAALGWALTIVFGCKDYFLSLIQR